ncbi:glycosyltransferase family 2 protein [Oceanobacter mangrovi]|uniref:glycosyltransferase family 2 protein n=1 Tax=Oceanobacter mangrovi TaxID=2862510 RepID=UPI001C8DE993|nr:glycosyltransferase family 2 protein [Oceanobacter mangrovi]
MTMEISAIIPTYHRPVDLNKCLESILRQTLLPDEVILIDDGDLGGFPMRERLEARGIECVYFQKSIPGVTESRNKAAEIARGELLVFLEDDVVLFDNYIEELIRVYREYDQDGQLGGVGGIIDNESLSVFERVFERIPFILFGISGWREGRVLRSGFATDYGRTGFPISKVEPVDFLLGGVSSFKREVFEHYQFSNRYRSASGYGQGEDKEFSYRVSKRYRLLVNPAARLCHYPAPKKNFNRFIKGRAFVLSRYYFFVESVKRSPLDWFFFWYAVLGYVLYAATRVLLTFRKKEWQRLKGTLAGVMDIIRQRKLDSL